MRIIVYLLLIAGTWMVQDGIASILYYLKKPNEHWYFNHAVRLIRIGFGAVIIACGIYLGGV